MALADKDTRSGELLAGRYRLGQRVFAGGVTETYRATAQDGSDVSVRVLRPEYALQAKVVDSFLAMPRSLKEVTHASLPAVLAVELDGTGIPFVVEDLVEGESLEAMLAGYADGMDVGVALRMLSSVIDALALVHARGLVHSAFEPRHVLIEKRAGGVPRVLHFGSPENDGEPRFTAYAAPEVRAGSPPTPACDVWALGMTLYRMLAGSFPDMRDDRTPVPFGEAAPHLPAKLIELVDACLAVRPERRLADASDVRERLQALFAELEQLGRPVGVHSVSDARSDVSRPLAKPTVEPPKSASSKALAPAPPGSDAPPPFSSMALDDTIAQPVSGPTPGTDAASMEVTEVLSDGPLGSAPAEARGAEQAPRAPAAAPEAGEDSPETAGSSGPLATGSDLAAAFSPLLADSGEGLPPATRRRKKKRRRGGASRPMGERDAGPQVGPVGDGDPRSMGADEPAEIAKRKLWRSKRRERRAFLGDAEGLQQGTPKDAEDERQASARPPAGPPARSVVSRRDARERAEGRSVAAALSEAQLEALKAMHEQRESRAGRWLNLLLLLLFLLAFPRAVPMLLEPNMATARSLLGEQFTWAVAGIAGTSLVVLFKVWVAQVQTKAVLLRPVTWSLQVTVVCLCVMTAVAFSPDGSLGTVEWAARRFLPWVASLLLLFGALFGLFNAAKRLSVDVLHAAAVGALSLLSVFGSYSVMAAALAMAVQAREGGVDGLDMGDLVRSAKQLGDPELPPDDVTDQAALEAHQHGKNLIEAEQRSLVGAGGQEDLSDAERLRKGRRNNSNTLGKLKKMME
ncbi:MAG: protein kinase [Myxococcales bacterium]|nr:protein kinase [Myxococcales bacterium]